MWGIVKGGGLELVQPGMSLNVFLASSSALLTRQIVKHLYLRPKLPVREGFALGAPGAPPLPSPPPFKALLTSSVLSQLSYRPPRGMNITTVRKSNLFNDPTFLAEVMECLPPPEEVHFHDASSQSGMQDTQAYLWVQDRVAYVVFRGTSSREDALNNLRVLRSEFGAGDADEDDDGEGEPVLVHSGFRRQFEAIEPGLTRDLLATQTEYDTLLLTGHSLGGALATLAALAYGTTMPHKRVVCHTFGSPRSGGVNLRERLARVLRPEDNWRVFHYEDPVAMIPMAPTYVHACGSCLCLGSGGEHEAAQDTGDALHWALRPLAALCSVSFPFLVAPHDIKVYVSLLRGLALRGA